MTIEIGDVLTRRMEGMKYFGDKYWNYPATVIEIGEETITCSVRVDYMRTMVFDAATGISENGIEHGWLVEIAEE